MGGTAGSGSHLPEQFVCWIWQFALTVEFKLYYLKTEFTLYYLKTEKAEIVFNWSKRIIWA